MMISQTELGRGSSLGCHLMAAWMLTHPIAVTALPRCPEAAAHFAVLIHPIAAALLLLVSHKQAPSVE